MKYLPIIYCKLTLIGLFSVVNQQRSFGMIEERISSKLHDLTNEILLENLVEEAKLSMEASAVQDHNDFDLWKQSIGNKNMVLSKNKYPLLLCSFDMGWQQRSSGNSYNSQSGHGLLVGGLTRKPICFVIKSKRCNTCITWKAKNKDLVEAAELDGEELLMPDHKCTKNHDGSSSSMEPQACLHMVIELYEKYNCIVERICADDDASTRSMLQWNNADYMMNNNTTVRPLAAKVRGPNKGKLQARKDKGRLPAHVPEPFFVADPNHRRKVLTGELLALAKSTVSVKCTMTKMDATRIGKNFSYMIRQLPRLQETEYEAAGKAVLDHHFDSHQYCGAWCRRKNLASTDPALQEKRRFYRSMVDDAALYSKLHQIVERFVTVDRLQEVAHGMDTQVNESFNNTFSWLAPKNKVYCGSQSLQNRLCMGIGINALGIDEYFRRLFKKMCIIMTPNVQHFLEVKESKRSKRIKKVKLTETKKQRRQNAFDKLKEDEAIAKKERAKRDGTYRTGQNMEDGSDDEVERPKKRKVPSVCKYCGKKGHTTTKSKKCLWHNNPQGAAAAAAVAAEQGHDPTAVLFAALAAEDDADELDNMDSMPLEDDPPSDMSLAAFQDCGTWDSDNDDLQDDYRSGGI
jgi:hypothetical protein